MQPCSFVLARQQNATGIGSGATRTDYGWGTGVMIRYHHRRHHFGSFLLQQQVKEIDLLLLLLDRFVLVLHDLPAGEQLLQRLFVLFLVVDVELLHQPATIRVHVVDAVVVDGGGGVRVGYGTGRRNGQLRLERRRYDRFHLGDLQLLVVRVVLVGRVLIARVTFGRFCNWKKEMEEEVL